MKIIADTHCHTIASTHAYSTIMENVMEAKKLNLYAIAITDHSTNMPGAPGKWYFENLKVLPKNIEGVNVLKGIEANIINSDGQLDIPDDVKRPLNWVVASIHNDVFQGDATIEDCTKTWINVADNPLVNVIAHSGSEQYKYDYEKVIPIFAEKGKLVEINNNSFYIRKSNIQNCKKIALLCKKYRANVVVNSDSHFCKQLGSFDDALNLLKEIDFPEELIINADVRRFENYLKKYTNFFE